MIVPTRHTETRDRLLIAAAWLIALGSLFLVKDVYGWGWPEGWPLFVIFVGTGTAVSTLLTRNRSAMGIWAIWWPLAVIVVGVLLLLSTSGTIAYSPGELLAWWPLAVIVLGAWFLLGALLVRPDTRPETLSVPLAGATEGEIHIRFGGGELTIGQAEPGALLSGRFEGGAVHRSKGPGRIEIEPYTGGWPLWWDRPLHWDVGLTGDIPVDLQLDTGANRSSIDLTPLRIRRLDVHTGASETRIRLPAAGASSARVEAGLASVMVDVPPGVAARIRSKVGLGSTSVDEQRFPRSLDGWASPDYESAANRVDIDLKGGLGSITVR